MPVTGFRPERVLAAGYAMQSLAMLATAAAMWNDRPMLVLRERCRGGDVHHVQSAGDGFDPADRGPHAE